MKKKLYMQRILLFLVMLIMSISTISCTTNTPTIAEDPKVQKEFDKFLNQLFIEDVQTDSITLNYTLAHPQNYGIHNFTPTFGNISVEKSKEDLITTENTYNKIKGFSRSVLSKDQQLIYDILLDYYTLTGDEEKFLLYGEPLGNTTGIQGQLPILLAEYNFYTKEDIKDYLQLLPKINDYFSQLVTYEQEKSKAGLFMSDVTADNIIKQCDDFIAEPEKNYLIGIFNDRIDSYEGLTDEEKSKFKEENKTAILDYVIPAYQKLRTELEQLKGTGKNTKGICYLPDGKQYYEHLAQNITGSKKSIKEMKNALNRTMRKASLKMDKVFRNDSGVYDDFINMKFPYTEPEKILPYLQKQVTTDFPELGDIRCSIKYVHKSLEDHLSPAFYLTPAIDSYTNNVVYINGGKDNDLSSIFPTVAHESYPGHLLQNVYFSQNNTYPIRSLMSYGGYSEGWATYCECYSYDISGLDSNVAEFAKQYNILNLCLYAQMDIGVNYDGWDLEQLKTFLSNYGIEDEKAAKSVYDLVIDSPANYLQYVIGYIEFADLRETAEKELGEQFHAKDFHAFLLKTGPAPFSVISDYMDSWITEQKENK